MSCGSNLHIAVEGCVGVGKTTLATQLARARAAALVLEDFEKNPFLEAFYSDSVGNVLETEMQFLLLHYHQLKNLSKASARETITDFTFIKDMVFAESNFVDPAEKEIFINLYQFLLARLPAPDLIIYLKGSDELIIERLRRRSRSIELKIDELYFRKLRTLYDAFFISYRGPIHVLDADNFDCLNSPSSLDAICKIIDSLSLGKAAHS
jgi:deoxyadenosine/deoxycytidine kinase